MKKVIFGTALASMALLSACSSDNELANVETTANNAIGFHVVGNKAETRANIINSTEDLKKTDFNVFAFTRNENGSDGAIFMGDKTDASGKKGIKINCTKGDWDYADASDLHYWPQDTHLNFYAVNPATVEGDMQHAYHWSIEKDAKTISYTSCDEYGGPGGEVNYDVMYDIQKDKTQITNNGKVKFQFKHILSQVVFKAKTALASMEVNIKEIKIHNFRLGGVFTLPTADATEGSWKLNDPAIPSLKWGQFTVVKDKDITVTSAGADISVDAPMLFVPQSLVAWKTNATTAKPKADADTSGEAYLQITCKIKQAGVYVFGSESEYKTLYVPFGTTWEIGKCHIYTLIFGGGYDEHGQAILKPINFEAETTKWVDDIKNKNNGNDINIDK